jgi:hypothetical protein
MKIRYPNAYIVGAQKSGTTSLFNWIGQHPDVYANPAVKDYPFFTDESLYKNRLRDFQKLFKKAGSQKIVLGADANLMYVPGAIERLSRLISDAKIIAILRNPVNRSFSAWRYAVERGLEKRTFYEAINMELKGQNYPSNSWMGRQMNYLEHGLYSKQLKNIYAYYQKECVIVLIYEDVINDPLKSMKEVFCFLDITESFIPNFSKENVTLGGQRSRLLSSLLYRDRPHGQFFWDLLRILIPKPFRLRIRMAIEKFNRIPAPPHPFPEDMRKLLEDYYEREIIDLETLLCRRLDIWRTSQ